MTLYVSSLSLGGGTFNKSPALGFSGAKLANSLHSCLNLLGGSRESTQLNRYVASFSVGFDKPLSKSLAQGDEFFKGHELVGPIHGSVWGSVWLLPEREPRYLSHTDNPGSFGFYPQCTIQVTGDTIW